ncbi:P-loop NTPase fold protein [Pseudomonas sp. B8(2017)]|uniref:P-loop NTPase fold protein n=1 Tax=Pseudomonas sp. B8(2017) TaxID=1981711 RepID=UPI00111C0DFB|nr:P-loop NTPase fold protein [Pseudomonas sp. B8(2017)]
MNDNCSNTRHQLDEHNTHLKNYIDYYKTLTDPGYAVLITGNWGSGKTHQITQILDKEEYTYVSLFGTHSTDEIYSSVYAKMFPTKAFSKELAESTNGATVGPIGFGGLISNIAKAILKDEIDSSKILIFDDLERSTLKTTELFGIFNKYIEHHKCRVIVLAHDKKITDDLSQTKEKVFGQTIEIIPQTSQAFDSFILKISDDKNRNILHNLKETILGIFKQSDTHSLRILKHSIEDLSRLLNLLSDKHKQHTEAIPELVGLFLALSLEVRSGRLGEDSLTKRYDAVISYQIRASRENTQPSAISVANSRYTTVDLTSNLLKDKDLVNLLIKGYYSQDDIRSTLEESIYFTQTADLPAWVAFINFDNISDKESNAAASKLIEQFNERALTLPGELLHLFALRFLLTQMELVPGDYDSTETACKIYLDDLLDQKRLEPYSGPDSLWGEGFIYAHNGYGYWVEEDYKPHFDRIVQHLRSAQQTAATRELPEHAKYLLGLISTNGDKFASEISLTFSGGNTFASIPVLANIEPSDFIQEWMGSRPENWEGVSRGLEQRYTSGQLSGNLQKELSWIKEVIILMDKEKNKAKGIRRKRIERAIRPSLRGLMNAA